MADDGLTGLGRRSAIGLAGAATSGVATIATILIANRSLGGTATGEFFVALSMFAIAQGWCSLGIDAGLQYWIPSLQARPARRLIMHAVVLGLAAGLVAAVVVFALAPHLADLVADGDVGDAGTLLRTCAFLLPLFGVYEIAFGALRACDRIWVSVVLDRFVRPAAQVIGMAAVAIAGGGATGMVFAWAVPIAASVLVALALIWRDRRMAGVRGPREDLPLAEFWRYTKPRTLARVAQVLTQRLDVLLLASLGTIEDAGVYGTVSRCMIAGVFVATAIQQMVQPRLRRLIVGGDHAAVKALYGASTTWLVLATWPVYLAMAAFAPTVLRAFGGDAERGDVALTILCLTMLVASACGLVDVVLLMLGRSWLSTIDVLVALTANTVLNLVLIGRFGMEGSAVAWAVAILLTNVVPLAQVARVGLHPGGQPLRTAMLAGLGCFGVPMLAARLIGGTSLPTLVVATAIGLAAYAVVVGFARRRLLLNRFVEDVFRARRGSGDQQDPGRGRRLDAAPGQGPELMSEVS